MRGMETCWFCETRPADVVAALEVTMRGKEIGTRKTGFKEYTTYYERRTIVVPRCAKCAANHRKRSKSHFWIGAAFLAPIAAGFVLVELLPTAGILSTIAPCAGGLIGIGVGLWLGLRLAKATEGTRNERHKIEFPAVKKLKEEGWTMIEHWVSTDSQRSP